MMNVTHRARHHRHIYGMVVRGPHFHNLREKKKKKKIKKKKKKKKKKEQTPTCQLNSLIGADP